jgi:hypothetical protein
MPAVPVVMMHSLKMPQTDWFPDLSSEKDPEGSFGETALHPKSNKCVINV